MAQSASDIDIREEEPDQLELSVDITNAANPPFAYFTVEQAKIEAGLYLPDEPPLRLIAWLDNQPVASGFCGKNVFTTEGRLRIAIRVLPEFRRRGIATVLYDRLVPFAREKSARALVTSVWKPNLSLVDSWLRREGYVESERMTPSELRVDEFDFGAWKDAEERPALYGIVFITLADEDSEENRRKLWELSNIASRDVPHDVHEDRPFEIFNDLLDRPESLRDCLVIARDGDRYVGFSLLIHQTSERALTGMTGVLKEYRNRGIALATKVQCVRLARRHGYKAMRTFNHVNNPAMLAVNGRLGYRPLPDSISFRKDLGE